MRKITLRIDGLMCSLCESHVNDAIRNSFRVKRVSSSHSKGETVILSEQDIAQEQLAAALEPTGYRLLEYESEPYEKKGLFSRR